MRKVKSYFIHLKLAYRICMFLIMPILVVGLELLCAICLDMSAIAYSLAIMVCFEVICDYFSFGGIYSKEGTVQNFYKTSPRGKKVYLNVFLVHGIRRALTIFGFTVFCILLEWLVGMDFLIGGSWSSHILWALLISVGAYAWSVIASFVCRKLDMVMVTWGVGIWGFTFLTVLNAVSLFLPILTIAMVAIVFAIISIAGTIFLIWYNRRKLEESYYDEKRSKRN